MKILIIIIMIFILYSLGSGLYFLIRDQGKQSRTVKALTWRIGLSLFLFILLLIAFALGIIAPHGIYG